MTNTMMPSSPPSRRHAAQHSADWGERIRTTMRGAGQTMITCGLVILLFVVYELWVTNIFTARKQNHLRDQLTQQWENGAGPLAQAPGEPGAKIADIPLGKGLAIIRIPRLGLDYALVIVQGTGDAQLAEGPGHYTDTALPGQVGDFAVAGHRVGKGSPFLNLDKLKPGDPIVIETQNFWYTYRVLGDRATGDLSAMINGVPGREIVSPSDIDVIDPVPGHPGAKPTQAMITLTTCHPRFSAAQRMIIHGVLDGKPLKKGPGVTPPALKEG